MLGFWEVIIILSILGWGLYSYVGKYSEKNKSRLSDSKEREDIIELDETSYEIIEEEDWILSIV